jgi:hypothetical protein
MLSIKSFFKELLSTDLKDYGTGETEGNVALIILFLSIGIVAAVVVIGILNSASAAIIRELIRHEAYTPEGAKTLSELGLEKNLLARYALSSGAKACRIIKGVDKKTLSYEEFIALPKKEQRRYGTGRNAKSGKFYIAEDDRTRAEVAIASGSSSLLSTVLSALFVLALTFVILLLLPSILTLLLGARA